MGYWGIILAAIGFLQLAWAASIEDKYEPMVAFICDRPAMHRGVNSWIADKNTDCLQQMEDVLGYCQKMYPDHNITNVVEASYLVTIPNWPMHNSVRTMPHRIRPFRCLVGGFQSDALLVPQHCQFDHRHDQSLCKGFSHWNEVADDACRMKGARLESFGMLLNCELGKFSGVEYVCCPTKEDEDLDAQYHPPQDDDLPDSWKDSSKDEEEEDSVSDSYDSDSEETDMPDENTIDLYEAYLRGQVFPAEYDNEHKRFLAAKKRMKQNQQKRVTKLLQDWQTAREHVDDVRKSDPKTADSLSKEITDRFQSLYSAYEQEHSSQKEQLVALHLQHVQAALNDRKRDTMDLYLRSLETGDSDEIVTALMAYIKAEERDRLHTVNHYEHVRASSAREALRIHPYIVNHLRLSEQRIDQALDMLTRYPQIEVEIRPQIEEFMSNFNAIANSIRDVVIPMPEVEEEEEPAISSSSASSDSSSYASDSYNSEGSDSYDTKSPSSDSGYSDDSDSEFDFPSMSEEDSDNFDDSAFSDEDDDEEDEEEDDEFEDEHDYERNQGGFARRIDDTQHVRGSSMRKAAAGGRVTSTLGFALGGVSVFVIILVAAVMVIRRKNNTQFVSHSYVEVDPSASPEERHVANMQMNGYENPTYMYFEQQQPQQQTNNPRA